MLQGGVTHTPAQAIDDVVRLVCIYFSLPVSNFAVHGPSLKHSHGPSVTCTMCACCLLLLRSVKPPTRVLAPRRPPINIHNEVKGFAGSGKPESKAVKVQSVLKPEKASMPGMHEVSSGITEQK